MKLVIPMKLMKVVKLVNPANQEKLTLYYYADTQKQYGQTHKYIEKPKLYLIAWQDITCLS